MESFFKKNILGQIITIFFVQASSTIAYAIFYSGLSIYLTQNKHYSQQSSATVTGLFLSLNYFLPLIGGFMADRIITYKNLYYLGEIISLAGCLLLIRGNFLHLSFALFLIGSLIGPKHFYLDRIVRPTLYKAIATKIAGEFAVA